MASSVEMEPKQPDGEANKASSHVPYGKEEPATTTQSVAEPEKEEAGCHSCVNLSWEDLLYKVQIDVETEVADEVSGIKKKIKKKEWKSLIKNMAGTARGGRVLAIMGPSGAGKTTFLNTVAGRIMIDNDHVVEGVCAMRQTVFTEKYKRCISFVAQDDIVMGKETPREAFHFNCRMRLGLSEEEAAKRSEAMIQELHMGDCANTTLGIPGLVKGVSGGEKKRTNIGSELITNPRILILDEPTTGLDSVNAFRVGQLLRDLAHRENRTVLCTIHSPSSELFALFDDVLLLAQGRIAYMGPTSDAAAYFAKLGHKLPPRYNPAEFYMNILQRPESELTPVLDAWDTYVEQPESKNNLSLLPLPSVMVENDPVLNEYAVDRGAGACLQLILLTKRSLRLYMRDPVATVGRLVQTVFFALLLGLFYWKVSKDVTGVQDRLGAIFMACVNSIMIAAMNGIATFPAERAVFLMEQANSSYHPVIYFVAKTLAEQPFQLIFPILFACISYFMVGFHNSAGAFFLHLVMVIITANTGHSFGLMAASIFPSPDIAMAFVPMILLPFMIVGGLFANTDRLEPGWIWLNYLSFVRYAFKGLTLIEFERIGTLCPSFAPCPYQTGQEVISFLGFADDRVWHMIVALLGFILAFRALAAFSLYLQGKATRSNLTFTENASCRQPSPRLSFSTGFAY